jgi:hypothetical protein
MINWSKFLLEGQKECIKDLKMKVELTAVWSDSRLPKESDWI